MSGRSTIHRPEIKPHRRPIRCLHTSECEVRSSPAERNAIDVDLQLCHESLSWSNQLDLRSAGIGCLCAPALDLAAIVSRLGDLGRPQFRESSLRIRLRHDESVISWRFTAGSAVVAFFGLTELMETDSMSKKGWSKEELIRDLRESCRIEAGDMVIIHSSMKEIGRVQDGTRTTVAAIKEAITPEGTLLMPALSSIQPDNRFYMAKTPSRVGLVTEVFRVSEGVKRSKHPTHSICGWGARAEELLAGHEKTSGVGATSPLPTAARAGADVLMIGCDMRTCTLVHAAEAIVRVPYLGVVAYPGYNEPVTLVDYDGSETDFPPKDLPGDGNGFANVQRVLEERGSILHCKFGAAECIKFSGKECLDTAVEMLKADPAAVLCDSPNCSVCPKSREVIAQAKEGK